MHPINSVVDWIIIIIILRSAHWDGSELHQFTYSEFDGFEWDRNQSRVDPTDGEPWCTDAMQSASNII